MPVNRRNYYTPRESLRQPQPIANDDTGRRRRGALGAVAGGVIGAKLGAAGGATAGATVGSVGGPAGFAVGSQLGQTLGSMCVIISCCTTPYSREVCLAREYRDQCLSPVILGGYYALSAILVPILERSKTIKRLVKKCLVDRLVDFGERVLGYKRATGLKGSYLVTAIFLSLCKIIGSCLPKSMVAYLIKKHLQ